MEKILGENDARETTFALHLLKLLSSYSGWSSLISELGETLAQLNGDAHLALDQHALTLNDYLVEQQHITVDVALLKVACLYPGRSRGVDPVACLLPSRGGFAKRRLEEATSAIDHMLELQRFYRWAFPHLDHLAARRYFRTESLPLPRTSKDAVEIAHTLGTLASQIPDDLNARLLAVYQCLRTSDGQWLAKRSLMLLDTELDAVIRTGQEILEHLACLVPGSLNGLHMALLDRQQLYPGILYHDADAETHDRLIEIVETSGEGFGLMLNHALTALAWIGSAETLQAFERWRTTPPSWSQALFVPPEEYTMEAGWHLDAHGHRRDLYSPQCYRLRPTESSDAHNYSPVQVVTPHNGQCAWCARTLVNLLDLDLRDVRLDFLNWKGTRLQVAICEHCSLYTSLFVELTDDGNAGWSSLNGAAPDMYDIDEDWALPQRQLVLGEPRKTPFEALVVEDAGSQIGGCPSWLDDAFYPMCPRCKLPMPCIGQVHLYELGDAPEGIVYAFLCAPCRMATTHYQQT